MLLTIDELHDVFCDAVVDDREGGLIFASFWGRDTAIQELLARLTLPGVDGGLSRMTFIGPEGRRKRVDIGNPERLDKLTGRMPKTNLFGELVQLWLFAKKAATPDFANRSAYLLLLPEQDADESVWNLIRAVCPLPLLAHWQNAVLTLCTRNQWLRKLEGYRINAVAIDLPDDEFGSQISEWVKQGLLELDGDENWRMANAYRHPDF